MDRTCMKKKISILLSLIITCCFLLPGCASSKASASKTQIEIPFSTLTWDSTTDDMLALEGSGYRTYKSTYGGTTYTFAKEYNNKNGTIKYMFDGNNKLMCIAWAYGTDDADELAALYKDIDASVRQKYGDSGYQTDKNTNYGGAWYLDNGHIVISTMVTAENKALQYSYINPASYQTVSGN